MTTSPPPLPPPAPRRRWRSRLLTLGIFLAGLLLGVGLTILVAVNRLQHAIRHPELAPERLTSLLTRRLDLTPTQADDVRAILEQRQRNLRSIRQEVWPRVRAELDATHDQIAARLDDDQRQEWHDAYYSYLNRWLPPDLAAASSPPATRSAQTPAAPAQRTRPPGE